MEIEFYEKIQDCRNTNDNTRWIYGSRWNFGYDSCIDYNGLINQDTEHDIS